MRIQRLLPIALIAVAGLTLGSGCPTVPKIEDRVVELALGATTTLSIPAAGILNTYDDIGVENLVTDIDLNQILDDAGVDASDLKDIKLAGISYRVTVPDPNTGRTINNATVTARRGAGAEVALITNFNQNVDAVSGWTTAPLSAAGVTLINGLLTDIMTVAKSGGSVANPVITYHVVGVSNPQGVTTNFTWELRLDLTIVGSIKVKVLN
jgi:hypothetical protein